VGILSHIGFDLISHNTNLLFYPWVENVYWFPAWWYTIWFEVHPQFAFGRTYAVGIFTILWGLLTLLGSLLFLRFLSQEYENRAIKSPPMSSRVEEISSSSPATDP
jgi:hypothetical protein